MDIEITLSREKYRELLLRLKDKFRLSEMDGSVEQCPMVKTYCGDECVIYTPEQIITATEAGEKALPKFEYWTCKVCGNHNIVAAQTERPYCLSCRHKPDMTDLTEDIIKAYRELKPEPYEYVLCKLL